MGLRTTQSDREILTALAEHRVLGISRLAVLLQRNVQSLRRRLGRLHKAGLLHMASRGFGSGPGRPERLLSLAPEGVARLKEAGVLDSDLPDDSVSAERIHYLDHQLLVNDFRVHLVQMQRLSNGHSCGQRLIQDHDARMIVS